MNAHDGTVLITGATNGLGAALADVFGKHYNVVGTTYDDLLADNGAVMWLHRYDASDPDAAQSLARDIQLEGPDEFDLVINCAGINGIREFHDLDLNFVERLIRINCVAPILLVKELLAREMFAGHPGVINITSDAAWRPMRHSLAYNTSKAGFDMATKQMARELTKPLHMTIVGIRPGKMKNTGMSKYIDKQVMELRGWSEHEAKTYYAANSVTGLESDPQDVAKFIYDLWRNPLFRTMSGACLDLVG
jgi:3-oxoacyl-[acyl-carrier protein] reductase